MCDIVATFYSSCHLTSASGAFSSAGKPSERLFHNVCGRLSVPVVGRSPLGKCTQRTIAGKKINVDASVLGLSGSCRRIVSLEIWVVSARVAGSICLSSTKI